VQFWLGTTHIALKHYLEGQEILEELSKRQPENLEVLRILAQSYSDYAVALHNRVAAEHPASAWAFRIHGQALENEGFCEAALGEYRKAQALKPDMEGVREAIARCQAKH
jgi:tetratricopeptide (TPR) repeat protein